MPKGPDDETEGIGSSVGRPRTRGFELNNGDWAIGAPRTRWAAERIEPSVVRPGSPSATQMQICVPARRVVGAGACPEAIDLPSYENVLLLASCWRLI
jgi:hypothetical protein